VFTASIQSIVPAPALAAYSASKFALSAFSKVLRIEMTRFKTGVRVSAIHPSGYKTQILANVMSDRRAIVDGLSQEMRARYGERYLRDILEQATPDQMKNVGALIRKDLSSVTDCLEHALFSKYPQAEYTVGPFCGTLINLYHYLPDFIFTTAISLMYQVIGTKLNIQRKTEAESLDESKHSEKVLDKEKDKVK